VDALGAGRLQAVQQLVEPGVLTELQPGPPAVDHAQWHQMTCPGPLGHRERRLQAREGLTLLVEVDQDHRPVHQGEHPVRRLAGTLQ
jgi:hypothetical protein